MYIIDKQLRKRSFWAEIGMKNDVWKNIELGDVLDSMNNFFFKRIFKPYQRYKRMLDKSQWWPENRLLTYQRQLLFAVVKYAYKNIPYYRGLFQVYGLMPDRMFSVDNFYDLPIIDKSDVRKHTEEMISKGVLYPKFSVYSTNGTTGTPLKLHRDLYNKAFEQALHERQLEWAGLKSENKGASLKGDYISPRKIDKGACWAYNFVEGRLNMSSLNLSPDNAGMYIDAMRYHGIEYLEGFPSSIYTLAKYVLESKIDFALKAVLTTAETLDKKRSSVIEEAFRCRVFDYYRIAENVAAIHTCEFGRYHLIPEYSFMEFRPNEHLDSDYYEVIGTSFTNMAMPLIRYRTGDAVKPSTEKCPCGRSFPVVEHIIGHFDDVIVTPSGRSVALLYHIFDDAQNLVEAQLYQPDKRHVVVRIVPDRYFRTRDGKRLLDKLQSRVGEDIDFHIEVVSAIPKNSNGKFRRVISEVKQLDD